MIEFKVGDKVRVIDQGLMMLMALMPAGTPRNDIGFIKELNYGRTGDALIEFSVGDDDMDEHSQVAPYPLQDLRLLQE